MADDPVEFERQLAEFDEQRYLAAYPDIAEAVQRGTFVSGQQHFTLHGFVEGRLPAPRIDSQAIEGSEAALGLPVNESMLVDKARLEIAMRAAACDRDLRRAYFELLWRISRAHFGIFFANLPEIATPLMFRAGSSDFANLVQVFLEPVGVGIGSSGPGIYSFPIPCVRTILDIGAYCGYTAVYFANRFPDASIIAVEPPGPNFDMLVSNTAAYPAIARLPIAVWPKRTQVAAAGDIFGDWGQYFRTDQAAGIPAITIPDILRSQGWESVDLIKCLAEDVSVDLLTAADRPWIEHVLCVITKPPAGRWPRPDDDLRLRAAFPVDTFTFVREGDATVFRRRVVPTKSVGPRPLSLMPRMPARSTVVLKNIPEGVNHTFTFGSSGLQIGSNGPGAPVAAVTFQPTLDGHTQFACRLRPGSAASARLRIVRASTGLLIVDTRSPRSGDTMRAWSVAFPPLRGAHTVTLSVEPEARKTEAEVDSIRFEEMHFR